MGIRRKVLMPHVLHQQVSAAYTTTPDTTNHTYR